MLAPFPEETEPGWASLSERGHLGAGQLLEDWREQRIGFRGSELAQLRDGYLAYVKRKRRIANAMDEQVPEARANLFPEFGRRGKYERLEEYLLGPQVAGEVEGVQDCGRSARLPDQVEDLQGSLAAHHRGSDREPAHHGHARLVQDLETGDRGCRCDIPLVRRPQKRESPTVREDPEGDRCESRHLGLLLEVASAERENTFVSQIA